MQCLYPLAHHTFRVAEVLLRVVPVACFSWRVQGVARLRLCVEGVECVGLETGRRHAAQCCELEESSELLTIAQPLGFASGSSFTMQLLPGCGERELRLDVSVCVVWIPTETVLDRSDFPSSRVVMLDAQRYGPVNCFFTSAPKGFAGRVTSLSCFFLFQCALSDHVEVQTHFLNAFRQAWLASEAFSEGQSQSPL